MRIAVCEDERLYRDYILTDIRKWADTTGQDIILSSYDSAEALLMIWGDVLFDIIILDIELKKMSGMDLARIIRNTGEDVIIVFITNYANYSLEGYDVNPLHYLLKP
jgi:two-component SAPR family response regulator